MPTNMLTASPTDPLLTPDDLAGVAQEATVNAVKADTESILERIGNVAATVGTVRHARLKFESGEAKLYFADPFDAQIDGLYTAFWSKTVIVRKNGSAPAGPTDGTWRSSAAKKKTASPTGATPCGS